LLLYLVGLGAFGQFWRTSPEDAVEWPARRMTMADTGNAIHLTLNATSCKKNRRTCSFTQVCRLIAREQRSTAWLSR